MQPPEMKMGPGVGAPEPHRIAVQASAQSGYSETGQDGNRNGPGATRTGTMPAAPPDRSRLERAMGASGGQRRERCWETAYRDSDGRKWHFRGKRARVLDMLVASQRGITQWDCLPWHTRLGASIHAMRRDGLTISTELEGPYRHARYRLAIALFGDDAPGEHRTSRLKNNQRKSNGGGHGE